MYGKDRLYDIIARLERDDLLFLLKDGLRLKERRYERYSLSQLRELFSAELREAASNSFANYFRLKHEYPYKQILIDVADKLRDGVEKQCRAQSAKCKILEDCTEEQIEDEILRLFDLKTKLWWKELKKEEKEKVTDKINNRIDADLINSINKRLLIKYRISKEFMDSVVTKGIVVVMLAVSAEGFLGAIGGSVLSQIGVNIVGAANGLRILTRGLFGLSGIAALDMIGGLAAGLAVFVPSTIYFYADTNYSKIIPTIVMLLYKVRTNRNSLTL